ncbi:MAG: quinone oxidoreductase family protein [Acidithiobacillales bacterium]
MKAIRIAVNGGPEVLKYAEVPDPQPKEGEALVAVEAIGVNFIEIYVRLGWYKAALPLTPGGECAGTVAAVGPGVTVVKPGDRVATFNAAGAYAEFAIVPEARLVLLPEGVTARQGAAAILQGMTAHYLTTATYPLKPGDVCLVHAAAGGVGRLLCQMAKRRVARVIGTVSTPEKATLAREAGADRIVLYTSEDFVAAAKEFTGGRGVNVIYDSVGKTTFEKGLDALAPRGMMALYGQASGPVGPFDPQLLNQKGSLFLTRPTLFHYVATREELLQRAGDVLGWVKEGSLKLRMEHDFSLAKAADAHRALEGRKTTGKVLLIP